MSIHQKLSRALILSSLIFQGVASTAQAQMPLYPQPQPMGYVLNCEVSTRTQTGVVAPLGFFDPAGFLDFRIPTGRTYTVSLNVVHANGRNENKFISDAYTEADFRRVSQICLANRQILINQGYVPFQSQSSVTAD